MLSTAANLAMYGLTLEDYQQLVEDQNGVCAICKEPPEFMKNGGRGRAKLYVDHDHETGKVRALLCHHCNCAVGFVKERLDVVQKLQEYLEWHKSLK